ncbi:uncharacterized protein LOC113300213 isoform X3 [Papaver somniferum]|uniref:uncharacterized protein LOC113300213 isoform X3 n=1 Tax=Papaver somniferum TaxID=3469 RepID=UPI000E6FDC3D|nr:uncharacterized protein LOC113300213 isoform X3 [Papaver somniferum]
MGKSSRRNKKTLERSRSIISVDVRLWKYIMDSYAITLYSLVMLDAKYVVLAFQLFKLEIIGFRYLRCLFCVKFRQCTKETK